MEAVAHQTGHGCSPAPVPPCTPNSAAQSEDGTAVFTLPYGSRVTFHAEQIAGSPEWIGVAHERDLLPYRALMTAIQDLPRPLQGMRLCEAALALCAARRFTVT